MEIFTTLAGAFARGQDARDIIRNELSIGDTDLELECEPDNEFDPHAVRVMHYGIHLGYVAKANNPQIFDALNAGVKLSVKIIGFESTIKPVLLISDGE